MNAMKVRLNNVEQKTVRQAAAQRLHLQLIATKLGDLISKEAILIQEGDHRVSVEKVSYLSYLNTYEKLPSLVNRDAVIPVLEISVTFSGLPNPADVDSRKRIIAHAADSLMISLKKIAPNVSFFRDGTKAKDVDIVIFMVDRESGKVALAFDPGNANPDFCVK